MKVNTINPGKVEINDSLTPEEIQPLTHKANPDLEWLSRQIRRIDPYWDEQGSESAYINAMAKLAYELRDRQWPDTHTKFDKGDRVYKTKGAEWQGRVVGTYSTQLTPEGYCVESEWHTGSVQIYPASMLEKVEA